MEEVMNGSIVRCRERERDEAGGSHHVINHNNNTTSSFRHSLSIQVHMFQQSLFSLSLGS